MTCLAFDIDGTIFDCGNIIVEAFQKGIYLFNKNYKKNIQIPSKEKIVSVLGTPTDSIFRVLFPAAGENDQQIINDICTECLIELIILGQGELFDGVFETVEKFFLEGYKILAASNGRIKYIESILKSKDLIKFFVKPIVTLNKEIKSKSDILKYYKDNICGNDLLIMTGDRTSDRVAAEENNIPFIGCSFGHAGIAEILGTRWIINDFSEIYDVVKEIEKYN